jgi:hypothetical protein
VEDLRN